MNPREVLIGLSAFALSLAVGFTLAAGDGTDDRTFGVGTEVNSSSEIATARFDNRTLDLFHEGGENASFYIDYDRDGSAEKKLSTVSDGRTRGLTELKAIDGEIYVLRMRYRDEPGESGDAWLRMETATRG